MRTRRFRIILLAFALASSPVLFAQQSMPSTPASSHTSPDVLTLLTYSDHKSITLSASDFKALPHVSVTIHNTHTNADESYSGVRASDLLA